MKLKSIIGQNIRKYKINKLRKKGLKIHSDCRITGKVGFGSEPYLISIGKRVTLTDGVQFITHDGGTWVFRNRLDCREINRYGKIEVFDNCFIGFRSIILPGVKIGPNSVVAAGSVVTKNVPPDTIVGGNPAKPISNLEEYIKKSRDLTINQEQGISKKEWLENYFWKD